MHAPHTWQGGCLLRCITAKSVTSHVCLSLSLRSTCYTWGPHASREASAVGPQPPAALWPTRMPLLCCKGLHACKTSPPFSCILATTQSKVHTAAAGNASSFEPHARTAGGHMQGRAAGTMRRLEDVGVAGLHRKHPMQHHYYLMQHRH